MEEYMESELSGIFRVKLVTKNIERGSPGTQFMHIRVNKASKNYVRELFENHIDENFEAYVEGTLSTAKRRILTMVG